MEISLLLFLLFFLLDFIFWCVPYFCIGNTSLTFSTPLGQTPHLPHFPLRPPLPHQTWDLPPSWCNQTWFFMCSGGERHVPLWLVSCLLPWIIRSQNHPWASCTSIHLPCPVIWPPSWSLLQLLCLLQSMQYYLPRESLCRHPPQLHLSPTYIAPIRACQMFPQTLPLRRLSLRTPFWSHSFSFNLVDISESHVYWPASLRTCIGAWYFNCSRFRGWLGAAPRRLGWNGLGHIHFPLQLYHQSWSEHLEWSGISFWGGLLYTAVIFTGLCPIS